jgi:hypothetical protein
MQPTCRPKALKAMIETKQSLVSKTPSTRWAERARILTESELGISMLDFKRSGDPFLSTKSRRVQDSIEPNVLCSGPYFDTMIGGQEEKLFVPPEPVKNDDSQSDV